MKIPIIQTLFLTAVFGFLAGCKLAVIVVEGGEVQSVSSGTCLAETVCVNEVADTNYSETFTAVPDAGWEFVRWTNGDNFLCADSTNPVCVASNTLGAENAVVESVVASDMTFYIMPLFMAAQQNCSTFTSKTLQDDFQFEGLSINLKPDTLDNTELFFVIAGAAGATVTINNDSSSEETLVPMGEETCFESYPLQYTSTTGTIDEITIDWPDEDIPSTQVSNIQTQYPFFIRHPKLNPTYELSLDQAIELATDRVEDIDLNFASLLMALRLGAIYSSFSVDELSDLYQQKYDASTSEEQTLIDIYSRIFSSEVTTPDQATLDALSGVDALTMPVLYCNEFPLPSDFIASWESGLELGGYYATHVALGIKWAQDNKCQVNGLDNSFIKNAANTILEEVNPEDGLNDVEIEALCLLALLDYEHLISQADIEIILDSQNNDGGWSADPSLEGSNQHTTLLALWLLTDLKHYNQSINSYIDQ